MYMTIHQRQLRKEILNGIEEAKDEAAEKYLRKTCNVVGVKIEEGAFLMHSDTLTPICGCPNGIGQHCNECAYYITHNKQKQLVFCMKEKKVREKIKMSRAYNKITNDK